MKTFIFSDYCRLDGLTGAAIDPVEVPISDSLTFMAARNEYASFQLAIKSASIQVEDINIDVSFETGDSVKLETGESVKFETTIYYEWFHKVEDKLIPDLLVPITHARELNTLIENYYQSDYMVFWVDVFVPKDITPGTYNGQVRVAANSTHAVHNITLVVSKAELTDESLIIADMNNYADSVTRNFPHLIENDNRFMDSSYFAAEKDFYRISHEHRTIFHHLPYDHNGRNVATFAPKLSGEGKSIHVCDWTLFDEHFGPYFDGTAFAGTQPGPIPVPYAYLPFNFNWPASYEKWGTEGYKIENRRILLDFIRHFEEKGWTQTVFELFYNHKKRYRYYPYDGDELRHEQDAEIIYTFNDIFGDLLEQSNVKVIFRTDASWSFGSHYNSEISKIIKMWAVGSGLLLLYPDSYAYMKNQGNILWMYGGVPEMKTSLLKLYEWPLRCLQNGFDGLLFWNATGIGADFLTCPIADGSQTLFYPGHPFGLKGVLPSLRLKYLRNTMQLVDLVKMHEGTWTFHKMRDAIDKLYGVNREQWHDSLPEAMRIPPHEMTNDLIGSSPRNNPSRNAKPDLPSKIKEKILEMAANYKGASSPWV